MTTDDTSGRRPRPGRSAREATGKPMKSRGFKDRPGGGAGPRDKRAQSGKGGPPGKSRGYKTVPPKSTVPHGADAPKRAPEPAEPDSERIAKRLARAGVASRREAEGLIAAGRVRVNGKVLDSPALNVTADDRIEIDGKPIPQTERTRLWLYHKPAGLVTSTRDAEGRPTVFERLPADLPRVISVGRLDINTEGLLLLTNDGGLARMLELPQTGWLRRYRVRAHGRVNQAQLDALADGIAVEGVFYGAIEARIEREQGSNLWLEIGLREGKNREVKKVLGALGLEVNRLIRISFGPFQLGALEPGAVLEIRGKTLREQLGARLIAESGADFEAPVRTAFSNRPVKAGDSDRPALGVEKAGDWVSGTRQPAGAGGGADKRRTKPGERREQVRERWSTRPPAAGAEEERKPRHRPNRGSNVWMAPGARPEGGKPRGAGKGTKPAGKTGRPPRKPRKG
ncbi:MULTISPECIES: pseudouridine synthase [unclassified Roseitalea]|uniref:pseudouridine synthase n=1 Tax=unclassified Roseitalea TaxID=2639107 RepID=UPI00273E36B6|nr:MULTISPECIES: pseudouridine synthase [unclassified Roseitalea]